MTPDNKDPQPAFIAELIKEYDLNVAETPPFIPDFYGFIEPGEDCPGEKPSARL